MQYVIIQKLIYNALLLLALTLPYEFNLPERLKKYRLYILGIYIGLIGIAMMSFPFFSGDGIIIDSRSILMSVTAFHFGTIPTILAATIIFLYRLYFGGKAVWAGILIIITASATGLLFRLFIRKKAAVYRLFIYYAMGLIVQILMLGSLFAMPMPYALATVKATALPVLIVFPFVTMIISYILQQQMAQIETVKKVVEAEDLFRRLIEGAPEAIHIQSDGLIVFVNPYAISLFGAQSAQQLIGTPVLDRYEPELHDLIKKRIHTLIHEKKPVPFLEQKYIRLDGSTVDVEVSAVPIEYNQKASSLVFARDISKRKELEAHMSQQQKLEAIGTLAGGVAHEINNPLNGIMNYAQLIMDDIGEDHPSITYVKEIIFETQRISTIVKNLLQFSRQEKQSHSYASVYDIINQTLSLINTIIKKDQIQLNLSLPENLPNIKCRSQQIQQVIMNLVTNARDALNEKYPDYHKNKTIDLSCELFTKESRRWLRLIVADQGNGIAPEAQQKVFEPFYSTKPKETGTGLGLAISFGIVRDHHGQIYIDSKLGCYTKFIVELPVDNGWTLKGDDGDIKDTNC